MSQKRLPSARPDVCLIGSRNSRCMGGTAIAKDVATQKEHLKCLRDPDGYRLNACGRCGHRVLYLHDYLERRPLGLASGTTVRVARSIVSVWRVGPYGPYRTQIVTYRATRKSKEKSGFLP